MPCFTTSFTALSTTIINALPSTLFNSSIFLSNEGPAATIIKGILSGITSLNSSTKFIFFKKCKFFIEF